ncbi:MAG: hypothetical protein ACTS73_01765 [Arsenophonus sp. NEOnobi-MAG3]
MLRLNCLRSAGSQRQQNILQQLSLLAPYLNHAKTSKSYYI